MSQRKNKKKLAKNKQAAKMVIPLPRVNRNVLAPLRKDIDVVFAKKFVFNAASASSDFFLILNGCAKPDPSTSALPTGWQDVVSNIYAFYRALSYRFQVTFLAQGDAAAVVWTYESNEVTTGTTYVDQIGNPYFRPQDLGGKSGTSKTVITGANSMDKIVGATPEEIMTADNYLGLTTYSAGPPVLGYPPDVTYLGIGVETIDGTNLSASVIVGTVEITWRVRVYDRHLQ
jgi:hypothetical protein